MSFSGYLFKFPLFSSRSYIKNSSQDQISVIKEPKLDEMIQRQKSINNMIYSCDLDENNQLNCRWIKVSS